MRKVLLLLVVVCVASLSVFAQSAVELKNAGNDALKAKDYKTALVKYEAYLKIAEKDDFASGYNCAYVAYKTKDYTKAANLFGLSIKNKYKASKAYLYKATAEGKLKMYDNMIVTLKEGIAALPEKSKKLSSKLAKHYLKQGVIAQKAKKYDQAKESYLQATEINSKSKDDAFFRLGNLLYNQGAQILQKVTPLATSAPEKYKAGTEKAKKFFAESITYLNEAIKISPENADFKKTLESVKGLLK